MKKFVMLLAVCVGVMMLTMPAWAQSEEELLAQLIEEEHTSVEALVLYPEKTRMSILETCLYPEALVKLESMQNKTSQAFQNLMENYPKETQEKVWDMTRYPGMINQLVTNGPKLSEELDVVLHNYPEEIRPKAKEIYFQHFPLLVRVDQMNHDWESAFTGLIREYPLVTQDALRDLIELPEVLTILTDNIRMTVLVGDLYRRRPAWLLDQMDSLNLVAARERAKELEDWKNNLEENPQAKEELAQSAQAFASEYGYDDIYYDYGNEIYYPEDRGPQEVIVEHHYYYHYPYWYGYPYWYMYPRWRPYPVWWDWGFYWGPGRVIVIIDLPSYYFTHWYFFRPYHHYHYPHFSSFMANHYYGHRHSGSSIAVAVNRWQRENRSVITDEWLDRSRIHPENFMEYGKMEEAREKYNRSHVAQPMDQREFLEKNKRKYPDLASEAERQKQRNETVRPPDRMPIPQREINKDREPARVEPRKEEPPTTKRPEVQPPRTKEPVKQPPKTEPQPPTRRKDDTQPQPRRRQEPAAIPKVDKASDYHKNTWEKSRTEPRRTEPAPRVTNPPARKPKPAPAPQPKTKTEPRPKERGN